MDKNHEKQIQLMIKYADAKEEKRLQEYSNETFSWVLMTILALSVVMAVLLTSYKIINGWNAIPSNWVLFSAFTAVIAISVSLKIDTGNSGKTKREL